MSRFAAKISKEDLDRKVIELAEQLTDFRVGDFPSEDLLSRAMYSLIAGNPACKLTEDRKKIDVDGENVEVEEFVRDGDLNYYLVKMGGDWQSPVYLAVYSDKKTIRCYVPDHAFNYNLDTKAAFGEDEDSDKPYLARLGVNADDYIQPDIAGIKLKIKERILVKETE